MVIFKSYVKLPEGNLEKMIILKIYDIRTKTLSGRWFQPLWKIWKSVGMLFPIYEKLKKCSEPPTCCNFLLVVSSNPIDCPIIRSKWLGTMVQITDWQDMHTDMAYNPLTNVLDFLDTCGDDKEQQEKDKDEDDDMMTWWHDDTYGNYHPRITNMIVTTIIINMTTLWYSISMIISDNTHIPLVPTVLQSCSTNG